MSIIPTKPGMIKASDNNLMKPPLNSWDCGNLWLSRMRLMKPNRSPNSIVVFIPGCGNEAGGEMAYCGENLL
jgi:hypothetical protein